MCNCSKCAIPVRCPGVKDAVRLAGRGLLMLGVLTWMSSCLYPKLKSYLCPATPPPLEGTRRFSSWNHDTDTDLRPNLRLGVLHKAVQSKILVLSRYSMWQKNNLMCLVQLKRAWNKLLKCCLNVLSMTWIKLCHFECWKI